MTQIRQLQSYPKEFFWFFKQSNTKKFSIACDSPKQAETLRSDLYNFRTAYCQKYPDDSNCEMLHNIIISIEGAIVTGIPNKEIINVDNNT